MRRVVREYARPIPCHASLVARNELPGTGESINDPITKSVLGMSAEGANKCLVHSYSGKGYGSDIRILASGRSIRRYAAIIRCGSEP